MRSLSGIGAVWDWRVSKGLLFYWDDQNISSVFSISFLCCASLSLTSFKIILLDCIVTIQDGRKQQHFWYIMLYYFKKGKNGTKMQKKKNKKQKENGGAFDWESFKTCKSVCLPQRPYSFFCASHLAPRLWKSRTLVLWLFWLGLGISLTTGRMSYPFTMSLSCQACLMPWCCLE